MTKLIAEKSRIGTQFRNEQVFIMKNPIFRVADYLLELEPFVFPVDFYVLPAGA